MMFYLTYSVPFGRSDFSMCVVVILQRGLPWSSSAAVPAPARSLSLGYGWDL